MLEWVFVNPFGDFAPQRIYRFLIFSDFLKWNRYISADVNGGRNENCVVYREDGTVEPGACYLSDKGEEDVFEPRVPLASHNMVANVLEDKHSPDQIIGPLWKTAISDPVVEFDFTNPAKGQSLIFTNVMQMMRNRCEFHNALNSVTQLESSVKPAEAPDSGNFTVYNGTENIQVAMKEVRDRGFCALANSRYFRPIESH